MFSNASSLLANVHRLIVIALFALASLHAFADYPANKRYSITGGNHSGVLYDTADAAVQAYLDQYQPPNYTNVQYTINLTNNTYSYTSQYQGYPGPSGSNAPLNYYYYCPPGVALNVNMCAGNPPPVCTAGQAAGGMFDTPTTTKITDATSYADFKTQTTSCLNGCEYRPDPNGSAFTSGTNPNGSFFVTSNIKQTGNNCTSGNTPVITTAPTSQQDCLAKKQSYITVNGVTSCIAPGTAGSAPVINQTTKTATPSSGSTTTTNTTYTYNSDGTVTTNTTNITTPAGGGSPTTTTDTKKQDKQSFCEENPTLQICKNTSFSGSCSAYTCDGDAVQCAIAKKIYQNRCDELKEVDDAKTATQAMPAYTTGQKLMNEDYTQDVKDFQNKTGSNSRTVNIPTSLSESGPVGFTAQGVQDMSITMPDRSITLPFSKVNPTLQIMGYILLALAYLAAYKIVTRDI